MSSTQLPHSMSPPPICHRPALSKNNCLLGKQLVEFPSPTQYLIAREWNRTLAGAQYRLPARRKDRLLRQSLRRQATTDFGTAYWDQLVLGKKCGLYRMSTNLQGKSALWSPMHKRHVLHHWHPSMPPCTRHIECKFDSEPPHEVNSSVHI